MDDQEKIRQALDSNAFEWAQLDTSDGKRVSTVLIPKFRPRCEVLLWGNRTFVLHAGVGHHAIPMYRECLIYIVIPIEDVTDNGLGLPRERIQAFDSQLRCDHCGHLKTDHFEECRFCTCGMKFSERSGV